jgi:transposase
MRGNAIKGLSIQEKHQMILLISSVPPESKLARNIRIIDGLVSGKTKTEVADELDISKPTVWKVARRFNIFRLEGIISDAPRIGRPRTISGEEVDKLLYLTLENDPERGLVWTGTQVAKRMGFPQSTTYRFLKERGVILSDSRTIENACSDDKPNISDIAGLFLSHTISVIAFQCKGDGSSGINKTATITSSPSNNNISLFYRKVSESFIGKSKKIRERLRSEYTRTTDVEEMLIFLDILERKDGDKTNIGLFTEFSETEACDKIGSYITKHPRFHLVVTRDNWSEMVSKQLNSVESKKRMMISLRLENLESNLSDWMIGPGVKMGVFAWVKPSM